MKTNKNLSSFVSWKKKSSITLSTGTLLRSIANQIHLNPSCTVMRTVPLSRRADLYSIFKRGISVIICRKTTARSKLCFQGITQETADFFFLFHFKRMTVGGEFPTHTRAASSPQSTTLHFVTWIKGHFSHYDACFTCLIKKSSLCCFLNSTFSYSKVNDEKKKNQQCLCHCCLPKERSVVWFPAIPAGHGVLGWDAEPPIAPNMLTGG